MSGSTDLTELPSFLRSAEAFLKHLHAQLDKMLGRNNGITFRADSVEVLGERRLRPRKGV